MDLFAAAGGNEKVLIRRTVSWQNVASWTLTGKSSVALCWSPDGKSLAVGHSDGSLVIVEVEAGMREQEEDEQLMIAGQGDHTTISTMHWAHVGTSHPNWTLAEEELEREEEWTFTKSFLDRSAHFLPPSTYHLGDHTESMASPVARPLCARPLSALFVATQVRQIHVHVHARFTLGPLTTLTTPLAMCASHDLSHLVVRHDKGRLTIFHIPTLAKDRYYWQQVASLHANITAHLASIQRSKSQVLQSWKAAISPLEQKLAHIRSTLSKYGISTPLNTILLRCIVIGPADESISSALDQAFTSVHMNDQLLVRMEKTFKGAVANVESMARSGLLAPSRSLVYDVTQLVGLGNKGGLALLESTRALYMSMELLLHQIVDARGRLQDLITWLRGTAAHTKAKGTASDSVQQENSRKRRPAHVVSQRMVTYLGNGAGECDSTTETLIGLDITGKLDDKKRAVSPASVQEGTTSTAVAETVRVVDKAFEEPRALFAKSIQRKDILLPGLGQSQHCAIHTRIGGGIDGCFHPEVEGEESQACRQWAIVATAREFSDGQGGIQLLALPLGKEYTYYLTSRMIVPKDLILLELGFYGDDGKSSLFSGENIGSGKEGRQGLGVLLRNESGKAELWVVQYDAVVFQLVDLGETTGSLLPDVDFSDQCTVIVQPLPRNSDESMDQDGIFFARGKSMLRSICFGFSVKVACAVCQCFLHVLYSCVFFIESTRASRSLQ